MSTRLLVVAALLLTGTAKAATAADEPEHVSDDARQVLVLLGHMGIESSELKEFAEYVDQKVYNKRFHIAEERMMDGTLQLNYRLSGGVGIKQMELRFTPDDSRIEATASTDRVMVRYKIEF